MRHLLATLLVLSSSIVTPPATTAQSADPPSTAAEASAPERVVARLDSLMRAAHERRIFNGNVLVARRGEIVYQAEFGHADGAATVPLTPAHRFHIGSVNKEFSAVGLAILAEEGLLSLDDPVSRHLPLLPAWAGRIQVRDLLRYTSGLPGVRYGEVSNDEEILDDLRSLPELQFEPGTDFHYNNNDIFLRQRIIEAVAGVPFADFVRTRMLEPCGMTGALVDPAPDDPRMTRAFDDARVEDSWRSPMSGHTAVTARDLYRWTRCLHSEELITETSLLELTESFEEGGKSALGMSGVEDGVLRWQAHIGSMDSFEAVTYLNRADEIAVALLTNNKQQQVASLTNAINQILKGEPYEVPKKSLEIALRAEIEHHGFERGMALLAEVERDRADDYELSNVMRQLTETGEYLREMGHFDDAVRVYELAATRFPGDAEAYRGLAETHLAAGDEARAAEQYRRLLALDPEDDDARAALDRLGGVGER